MPEQTHSPNPVLWFRPDVRRDVARAFLRAFGIVTLALLASALAISGTERAESLRFVGWVVGGACLVAGPTYLLLKLHQLLSPDIYLAIHQHGVRWTTPGATRFVSWPQIDDVDLGDGGTTVCLRVEGAEPLVIAPALSGITHEELVELLLALRTKALMGLTIRPPG